MKISDDPLKPLESWSELFLDNADQAPFYGAESEKRLVRQTISTFSAILSWQLQWPQRSDSAQRLRR